MAKYLVAIEETVVQEFTVEADTPQKARDKAIENYYNGTFVVSPGEVQDKKIAVFKNADTGELLADSGEILSDFEDF